MIRILTVFLAFAGLMGAQGMLRMKNPPRSSSGVKNRAATASNLRRHSHYLVQTSGMGAQNLADLLRDRDAKVVKILPGSNYVILAPDTLSLDGTGIIAVVRMDGASKVSTALLEGGLINFFVAEFHPDVDAGDAEKLVLQNHLILHPRPDMPSNQRLIEGSLDSVVLLAEHDELAYVFPASDDLIDGLPVYACAGALTQSGSIGQYIATIGDGWDGPGKGGAALTYSYEALTGKLSRDQVTTQIERALGEWAKAASVTFSPTTTTNGEKNLNFLFASGSHGDPYPFDGPGQILAHTFFPVPANSEPLAGDLHFDADESWQIGADIDLFSVALHELGHSLGLGHADTPGAVMYPYYKRVSKLADADIAAIQTLYAAALAQPGPTPTGPAPTPDPFTPTGNTPVTPVATALSITVPANSSVTTATMDLTGTTAGGFGDIRVAWGNSQGQSGWTDGIRSWHLTAPLAAGQNTITITATDETGASANGTVTVTRTGNGPATTPTQVPTPTPIPVPTPTPTPVPTAVYVVISSPARSIVTQAQFTLSGTAQSPVGIANVKWTNSRGGSGVASGTAVWSAAFPLLEGDNSITATAVATDHTEASQTIVVTYAKAGRDATAPSLTINNPSTTSVSTQRDVISVSGIAQDNVGVVEVSWINSTGSSGMAAGTTNWSTGSIPLLIGDNRITINAKDAAGNVGWRAIVVTRR